MTKHETPVHNLDTSADNNDEKLAEVRENFLTYLLSTKNNLPQTGTSTPERTPKNKRHKPT